jgi:mRNA export factor
MSLFGGASAPVVQDFQLPSVPQDGISSLAFNPAGNLLVAASWDNSVRCWELQRSHAAGPVTAAQPKAEMKHEGPVLSTVFTDDGTTVFSGSGDNTVKMWSLAEAGHAGTVIGKHDQPVRTVRYIPEMRLVASASWDKTVKFWDARQSTPTHSIQLPDKSYSMDVKGPFVVVATADRKISTYNLGSGCTLESCMESTLKNQTRCVSIFPDLSGFAVGSIEGRVSIEYFGELPGPQGQLRPAPTQGKKAFAFKCHREAPAGKQALVYPVNCIDFHPAGTFLTVGSDGCLNTWDKDSRQRLKAFPKVQINVHYYYNMLCYSVSSLALS